MQRASDSRKRKISEAESGLDADKRVFTGTDHKKQAELDDGLCDRCRALGLEEYYDRPISAHVGAGLFGPQADITRESIQEGCSLCRQLAVFLNHEKGNGGFRIHCYDLWSSASGHYYPYLMLTYLDSDHNLVLHLTKPTSGHQLHSGYHKKNIRRASGRLLGRHPDFELVKEWLKEDQTSELETTRELTVFPFRLIDCINEKLCVAPLDCPYIALSYVWGNVACEAPLVSLELPKQLPKTIQDTIAVARALEVPYLWVDRYCIDQSNASEVHQVVQNMDKIYSQAALTIIASAGNDSTCGLPGVGTTPRHTPKSLRIGTHLFAELARPGEEIRTSKWNSRGWTFQESLLSKRRLVFTESQVYFQSDHHTFTEDNVIGIESTSSAFKDDLRAFPLNNVLYNSTYIYDRLEEYFPKHLSFSSDALKAFEGIFAADRVARRSSHFWGIPILSVPGKSSTGVATFTVGLTWKVDGLLEECEMTAESQRTEFPSWSWAAQKAGRPNKGLGRLHFQLGAIYFGAYWSTISLLRLDGRSVDLDEYATRMEDYKDYLPQIDVSNWSISAKVLLHRTPSTSVIGPKRKEQYVHFDGVNPDLEGKNTMVVFMYAQRYNTEMPTLEVKGLVVEEVADGHWRRVGVWSASKNYWEDGPKELREPMWSEITVQDELFDAEKLLAYGSDTREKWLKRTFRLV